MRGLITDESIIHVVEQHDHDEYQCDVRGHTDRDDRAVPVAH